MLRRLQVFGDDTGTIGFEKHAKPVIDLVLEHLGVNDVNGHHLVSEEIISTMGELIRRIAGNGIVLSDQKVEAKILDITEIEMKNFQAEQRTDPLNDAIDSIVAMKEMKNTQTGQRTDPQNDAIDSTVAKKEMENTQAGQQHDALLSALEALLKQIRSSERVDFDDTAATRAVEGMIRAAQSPFLRLLLHWQTLR